MVTERLSPLEAMMWRIGREPALRMTVGNLMVLDQAPPLVALSERLSSAAEQAPRLHRRIDDPMGVATRPAWVDSREFDARDHLRTMAVPSPGTTRQVLDLIALLEPSPFAPDRPPWDVTVIEGLEGGRAGLYVRAHHAMTDGVGGLSLLDLLLDEPEPSSSGPTEPTPPSSPDAAPGPSGNRKPGTLTLTIDLTTAARPVAAGLAKAREIEPLGALARSVRRTFGMADSISRQVMVDAGPMSPLPPSRSTSNHFEVISVRGARAAALALGGSRNDLLVAATAAGLGLYHEQLGLRCPELRLVIPARRQRDGGVGGNWFGLTWVEIPTGSDHPGPQFGVVAERLARARSEPAMRLTAGLASAISRLPTRLLLPAVHAQASSVDLIATSLPGLRGTGHVCGAAIEASYPFGPRLRCLANVTCAGNEDRLDVGIGLDPTAITDPGILLECLVTAFGRFVPSAGSPARPKGRGSSPPV